MTIIKHRMQPTPDTCVATCIAMILDEPVPEVVADFHHAYTAGLVEVDEYLHRNQVKCRPLLSSGTTFQLDSVYILAVPSLNLVGMMHQVLMYYDPDGTYQIADPNTGRNPDIKCYVAYETDAISPNRILMRSYCTAYEVWDL